jgi:hypothetical protein
VSFFDMVHTPVPELYSGHYICILPRIVKSII